MSTMVVSETEDKNDVSIKDNKLIEESTVMEQDKSESKDDKPVDNETSGTVDKEFTESSLTNDQCIPTENSETEQLKQDSTSPQTDKTNSKEEKDKTIEIKDTCKPVQKEDEIKEDIKSIDASKVEKLSDVDITSDEATKASDVDIKSEEASKVSDVDIKSDEASKVMDIDIKSDEASKVERLTDVDQVSDKDATEEEEMDTSVSPKPMPKRGRKRGRSPEPKSESPHAKKRITNTKVSPQANKRISDAKVSPQAKKRISNTNVEKTKTKASKVSHPTHPDLTIPGVVLTLGEGDVGQLGLGEDIIERGRPAHVKLEDKIVQVSAGGMHTVCLTNKGKIYTFGCNDESALGRDTSEEGSETYPAMLDLSHTILLTSAGDSHTAVLTDEGRVFAWGNFRDANGSMGLTSGGIHKEPLEMLPGEIVVKIVSGGDHLVCLTNKGEVFTGGCAEQGQLGRVAECFASRGSRKGIDSILKMGVVRCKKHNSRKRATFCDIWAGQFVTFAKEKETGDIYAWGLNNYYQLGFDDMLNRFVPEWVTSFSALKSKIMKIQAGQHHTVLLDDAGKVYTLGRAEYGRLGIGENPGERSEPALVKTISDKKCIDIAAGQSVSFALMEDGSVYSWGMGTSRQLGTGSEDDVWEPTKMAGKQLETRVVVSLAAGGQHTVLLSKDKS